MQELFLCGGMGFLLAAYYDVFRLLRLLWRPKAIGVFVQDVLFCLTGAVMVFLFSLAVTDGVLRVYLFVGLLAGFFAYRYTIGRWVVSSVARLLRWLSRYERWLFRRLKAVLAPFMVTAGNWWRKRAKKGKKDGKKSKKILKNS